eukprot:gene1615-33005_t
MPTEREPNNFVDSTPSSIKHASKSVGGEIQGGMNASEDAVEGSPSDGLRARGSTPRRSLARELDLTTDEKVAPSIQLQDDEQKAILLEKIFKAALKRRENKKSDQYKRHKLSAMPASTGIRKRPGAWGWCVNKWYAWNSNETRAWIFQTVQQPETSTLAWAVSGIIVIAILASTVTFCMESVPEWEDNTVFQIIDYVCIGIFTLDYLVRLFTCPNLRKFAVSVLNFIDLCAILPFWIELMVLGPGSGQADQTRILRILRFFNMSLVIDAVVMSYGAIMMLIFMLIIMLVVFASIVYYIEGSKNGAFYNIPQAMYFVQTTLTTTGYGDIVPITPWGKLVIGLMMVCAIVILALPITVIGSNFSSIWAESKNRRRLLEMSPMIYSNFKTLIEMMQRHKNALDDIIIRFEELRHSIEADILAVRDMAQQARLVYLARASKGQTPGWDKDMYLLHQLLESMREKMGSSRDKYVELEGLLTLSRYTKASDYITRLGRLEEGYKNLHNCFVEGTSTIKALGDLTAEVQLHEERRVTDDGGGRHESSQQLTLSFSAPWGKTWILATVDFVLQCTSTEQLYTIKALGDLIAEVQLHEERRATDIRGDGMDPRNS